MIGDHPTDTPTLADDPSLEEAPFDWSQMDLARHDRLVGNAQLLVEMVKGCVGELDDVLREFVAAAERVGLSLRHEREPDTLRWALTLSGKGFQARGMVEIAVATANCVSISALPDGDPPLRYEVALGERIEEFPARLSAEFRTAVVTSVLDAECVISV